MRRRLIAPAAYVQGPGALAEEGAYEGLTGETALVLGGTTALEQAGEPVEAGLGAAGIDVGAVESGVDACTFALIESLADRGRAVGADLVVAVGGGVALDAGKGVAEALDAELATVPTVASTDAPCSSVAVVYDDAGGFDGYVHRDRNPELVLVDTRVIAESPVRFLEHGMGDAFATRFEAEAVARSGAGTHAGEVATDAALVLARRAYDNLASHGADAAAAVAADAVTPAVERVVETNTLLSGVGFESGGLAAAHAFSKGFSRVGAKAPHGLVVAFGAIAGLVLEDRPAVLEEALALYHELGLTTTLEDIGVGDDDVGAVGVEACREDTTMANESADVSPEAAADALRTADELVRRSRDG